MSFKEDARHFLMIYKNGDTFFFTLYKNGDIYCQEFNKQYQQSTGRNLLPANSIIMNENNFELINAQGETIYSLEHYKKTKGETIEEDLQIERFYIDSDVRNEVLENGKIIIAPSIPEIPGLVNTTEIKGYSRKRTRK